MYRVMMALVLALGLIVPIAGAVPASAAGTIVVQFDNPTSGEQNMSPAWLAGWAVDTASKSGTGITSVAIYMDGDMNTGTLLGQASYGGDRPDVAAVFGNENFRHSGWTMALDGLNIPMGPHTFTAVAYSATEYAAASVENVTLAPTQGQVAAYPYSGPAGLPQIGNSYPGQPGPATPSSNLTYQSNGLQVSATLSNVEFVTGQNYYNMLPTFNGYAYQGLVLPNGTVLNTGSTFNNGQLMYNGSFVPVTSYISPVTLQPVSVPSTRYGYNTVLPDGTVVPTVSGPTGYGMGSFWSSNYLQPGYGFGYQPGLTQVSPGMSAVNNPNNPLSDNVILYRPYSNGGWLANITLPQPSVFGNGFTYSNFNFNGNAAMQATLVARVTTPDGNPVQGAMVSYNGYQLPMTDGNGITTGTILFPITTGQDLSGTVHAEFNGMTADVPLVLNYTLP